MTDIARPLSLLWPPEAVRLDGGSHRLSDDAAADLNLAEVVSALVGPEAPSGRRPAHERFARRVLTELVQQPEVIGYRQAVLADLLGNSELCEQVTELLPALEALADVHPSERYRPTAEGTLERVARRLADLELLVDVVGRLERALSLAQLESLGLRQLLCELRALRESPTFQALERELPGLRATLASVRSVTIGVNLGPDLMPQSATILGFGSEPIEGRRALLSRLLGGHDDKRGISPLQRGEGGPLSRPNELVRDLRHLLGQVVGPVQVALERYAGVSTARLGQLGAEFVFLLGAARLVHRLRGAGLPMCCPELASVDSRMARVCDAYDVGLALAQLRVGEPSIVTNGIAFDAEQARVWVLTGPNRGGKTTYTRAIGLIQVLFQAGLYVPAGSARISAVDAIYTHFPTREDAQPGRGRLDAEAERLAAIFRRATARSLILLNEALAGTSALEALDLARGVVRALRLLGGRAVYVTHLHELAAVVEEINATTPGDSRVASLVASAADASIDAGRRTRTYRIQPGPPGGISFAAEIAEHHGISFEQLAHLLRERGS